MIMLLVNRQFLLMLSLARIKETLTILAIPSGPFLWHFGIVFGGQLQCKFCVAIGSFGMGDEFHLGTLKKNVHSFNRTEGFHRDSTQRRNVTAPEVGVKIGAMK